MTSSDSSKDWTPRLRADLDPTELTLSPEEAFILSRLDGATSVQSLVFLTGQQRAVVEEMLERLRRAGALEEPELESEPDPDGSSTQRSADSVPRAEVSELVHQERWARELKVLDVQQRVARASSTADLELLSALSFDTEGEVIAALLDNAAANERHARLVARHHRTRAGLEVLLSRSRLAQDSLVQHALLRNPMATERLVAHVLGRRGMDNLFRLRRNRDVTEAVRRNALRMLRRRFQDAAAEERVTFLLKTEGRCLDLLVGIPLDDKTVALMCRRTIHSTMLVRSFARWSSTPPMLLRHLLKQAAVKRNRSLKMRLLKHPNCPASAKREQ